VALLVVAALGLTAFAFVERHVRVPMVDFDFLRSKTFLGASLAAFIGNPAEPQQFVSSLGDGLFVGAIVAAISAVVAWTLVTPELRGGAVPAPTAGEAVAPPSRARASRSVRRMPRWP
jgi:hypothetical protein